MGGAKQRMTLEELTKHLKDKSISSIKEWIERLLVFASNVRVEGERERAEKQRLFFTVFLQEAAGALGVLGLPGRASKYAYKGLRISIFVQQRETQWRQRA